MSGGWVFFIDGVVSGILLVTVTKQLGIAL